MNQKIIFFYSINSLISSKKESPDVDTTGLLVKALISSYFKYFLKINLFFISSCNKDIRRKGYEQYIYIPLIGYIENFFYSFSISAFTKSISFLI